MYIKQVFQFLSILFTNKYRDLKPRKLLDKSIESKKPPSGVYSLAVNVWMLKSSWRGDVSVTYKELQEICREHYLYQEFCLPGRYFTVILKSDQLDDFCKNVSF